MDFGLCIVTTRDPNDVLYAFTQAENHGFTFVGLFDSPYNFHIMNFMWFGGISHEKAMRNMELFAREVMPRLAAEREEEPAEAPVG